MLQEEGIQLIQEACESNYQQNNVLILHCIPNHRLLGSSQTSDQIQSRDRLRSPQSPQQSMEDSVKQRNTSYRSLRRSAFSRKESQGRWGTKRKRSPRNLHTILEEDTPFLGGTSVPVIGINYNVPGSIVRRPSLVVQEWIYFNMGDNLLHLTRKLGVVIFTPFLSLITALGDAALAYLSSDIIWIITERILRQDQDAYPIGHPRLEVVCVLIFSIIMITSFFQVALKCFGILVSEKGSTAKLGLPVAILMASVIGGKAHCWIRSRRVKLSNARACTQEAITGRMGAIMPDIWTFDARY